MLLANTGDRTWLLHAMNGPVVVRHGAVVQQGFFNQLNDRQADGAVSQPQTFGSGCAVMMPSSAIPQRPRGESRKQPGEQSSTHELGCKAIYAPFFPCIPPSHASIFFMLSFCYFGECMHVLFALLNFKCQHPQPQALRQ